MYKNALLIYNGNAGQKKKNKLLGEIIPILSNEIDNLTIAKTKKVNHAEEIAYEKGKEYDVVISLGGDGTLHEVINGIARLKNPPIVAILPSGTCNDFARSLNIPLNLKDASNTILKGNVSEIDIGKVNNRYFTNFVGTGLITDISENVNSNTKNIMGRISYYTSTIKSMSEKDDFEFILHTENNKLKDKAGMVVILNGNHVGSTLVPVKNISMTDGMFDIFIVYNAGFSLLIKYLTQKENFEENITENEIKHIKANEIKLETKNEMMIDTDGEVYLNTPVNVDVENKKIKFITG
ncbi:diacylglycerol/lipid kinase family protein [Senegalia massiliensis]|uniref:diacylglycerol/lipid kinase family protein n=1 Tax=Senegalia massiliensis TaxID=1720316 RepID=UPI0013EF40F4|nr:diacylglycerol kinase family protein [Senegalia massiliensis]